MKLRLLTTALLAMAGAAFLPQHASAATTTYADGDLLIGFRSSTSLQSYIIDIGPVTSYVNSGAFTVTTGIGNTLADLNSTFLAGDATWATDGTVTWAVIGAVSSSGVGGYNTNTLLESRAATANTPGVSASTAPTRKSSGLQSTPTGYVQAFGNSPVFAGQNATSGNAFIQNNSDSNSWNTQMASNNYFGTGASSLQGSTLAGLDLYLLQSGSGSGSFLGTFDIDLGTGAITYTSAVPEPSAYALMILGGFVLFWSMKRRNAFCRV